MDWDWWKLQFWDKAWYLVFWPLMLIIARYYLVNPIVEAIRESSGK